MTSEPSGCRMIRCGCRGVQRTGPGGYVTGCGFPFSFLNRSTPIKFAEWTLNCGKIWKTGRISVSSASLLSERKTWPLIIFGNFLSPDSGPGWDCNLSRKSSLTKIMVFRSPAVRDCRGGRDTEPTLESSPSPICPTLTPLSVFAPSVREELDTSDEILLLLRVIFDHG